MLPLAAFRALAAAVVVVVVVVVFVVVVVVLLAVIAAAAVAAVRSAGGNCRHKMPSSVVRDDKGGGGGGGDSDDAETNRCALFTSVQRPFFSTSPVCRYGALQTMRPTARWLPTIWHFSCRIEWRSLAVCEFEDAFLRCTLAFGV